MYIYFDLHIPLQRRGRKEKEKRHHYNFVTVLTAIETKVPVWQVTKRGLST